MEELQALGEELVALASDQVKRIDIPDDLRSAVSEAQRMTKHDEARRRQMQYIGKLMRSVEVEPIRAALALVRAGLGITLCMPYARLLVEQNGLVMRPLVHPQVQRSFWIFTRKGRSLSPAAQGFLDFARGQLARAWA